MSDPEKPDEQLLLSAGRGDLKAFAKLVQSHQAWVWGIAYRFLGEAQSAEDVVQEAFLRLFKAAPRFDPRAAFRTYFYVIITRLCLDQARKKRPINMDTLPETADPTQNAADQLMQQEMSNAVRAALDRLSGDQRMAVVLHYYEGLDYRGIAEVLQVSTKAVERLLSRARKRLRTLLPV